jgi:hypothetical protein
MKPREVSLEWLSESNDRLAKQFRQIASRTSPQDCVLCAMFFNDVIQEETENGNELMQREYNFNEIDESEIEHFQQIADINRLPIKIIGLTEKVGKIYFGD